MLALACLPPAATTPIRAPLAAKNGDPAALASGVVKNLHDKALSSSRPPGKSGRHSQALRGESEKLARNRQAIKACAVVHVVDR